MRSVRSFVVAVLAVVVLAVPAVVLADGRVALVVGNSTYAQIGRLPNPDNDARDLSVSLRRLGFEVTTEFNVDRVELTEALRAFTRRSAGADVSLVFYAGHGIEMDGVNATPSDACTASFPANRRIQPARTSFEWRSSSDYQNCLARRCLNVGRVRLLGVLHLLFRRVLSLLRRPTSGPAPRGLHRPQRFSSHGIAWRCSNVHNKCFH